ncbi:MAG: hypothetical protein HZC24_03950 [Rhodocyclales bacterium]|nr:hypothetical protein [Rhodocyclales bacterium]
MFATDFSVDEAKTLIAFIADLQGASPPLPQPPLPPNWVKVFDPPPIGAFDNKWQLWQDGSADRYAVIVRGTTYDPGSIVEDLLSVMVPASGALTLGKLTVDYKLADEPRAAVHLGFLLGTLLLLLDPAAGIVAKLSSLPQHSDVFVAGHSQGAGIATLCRAFLHHSDLLASRGFNYKTYVFAQPKPGNDHFGYDFERALGTARAFRITNDQDWVPQVPFTIELPRDINEPNPMDRLKDGPFGIVPRLIASAQDAFAKAHVTGLKSRIEELERVLGRQDALATHGAAAGAGLNVAPTLNFMGCGVEIVRAGTPGTNPDDPKDFMWQHHAAMYYKLLCEGGA